MQNVFVSAIKDTEMYSMAFTDGDSLVNTGAQPVKIVLGSSCGTEERPTDSEANLVHDLHPYVQLRSSNLTKLTSMRNLVMGTYIEKPVKASAQSQSRLVIHFQENIMVSMVRGFRS